MAKLSAVSKKRILTILDEKIPELALLIWRKENNCPNLPDFFKEKSVDYYRGLLDGAYTQVEDMLHDNNIYCGWTDFEQKVPAQFNQGKDVTFSIKVHRRHGSLN